jgi:N-acetylglucosamine-6-sulfatase
LVENVDFAPTLLDFAGAAIPSTVQGRSFRSLLETGQESDDWKDATYYRYWMHMAHHDNPAHIGLRTKTHKLIFYYGCNYDGGYRTPPGWELYDLINDPAETVNIYDNPENKDLVADLKVQLADLRQDIGDDGTHYPACEKILKEFWEYDEPARSKAVQISHDFLDRRLGELDRGDRTPKTSVGTDHQGTN